MTGGFEVTVLALRVAIIAGLYAFLLLVLIVVWTSSKGGRQADGVVEDVRVARLVIVDPAASGLEPGVEFPLVAGGAIGRAAPNTIVLPDAGVSARHGRIAFRRGGWWVEDLQSANGTYVNGNRVDSPVALKDGDELEVAQVRLRMEIA